MRAANKYVITAFSAVLLASFFSAPVSAQTFGGGNTSTLYGGASNSNYFQSPSAVNQSGTNAQATSNASVLQTVTTNGLVVIGVSTPVDTATPNGMTTENTEILLFSAFAALVGIGSLALLWRMIKNSY